MNWKLVSGMSLPFVGTMLGVLMVFFVKNDIGTKTKKVMLGFSAGVMMASAIWSLILPALDLSSHLNKWSFAPPCIGFLLGIVCLVIFEKISSKFDINSPNLNSKKLLLGITLHNIPEGMAVGIALASAYFGYAKLTITASLLLSIGIAIQNVPEGAIVSLPLHAMGMEKSKAFLFGFISAVVEPIASITTFFLTSLISTILPYILSFGAGATIYVIVTELIPEAQHDNFYPATLAFATGFVLMMILDVVLWCNFKRIYFFNYFC